MLRYKNTSVTAKTFYGTTFKPGEEKDVPGYINHPKMVRINSSCSEPKELPKATAKTAPVPNSPAEKKHAQVNPPETKQNKESNKEEN